MQCPVTAEVYVASKASANGMTYISPPNRGIAMELHVLPLQLAEENMLLPLESDRSIWIFYPGVKKSSYCTSVALQALPSKKEKITSY